MHITDEFRASLTDMERGACDILDAAERLATHQAYCRDMFDRNGVCTMPFAHKIGKRAIPLYQECVKITNDMVSSL